ncbi:hypothetical protein SADUNF_Sadunf12G0024500 [Salix dunnii]|uniref:Uncharacterized protein n=1 Tax=Salix dunnii TaxID=1413687 RepID=A0A835JK64_9ROSI|nr:hypothetical protein SADUNF_Sadunf12G0024500 [Salix dunnii]
MSLPEGIRSLKMLRELRIRDCPHLQRVCEKERGLDWPNIAHSPDIHIDETRGVMLSYTVDEQEEKEQLAM